MTATWGEVHPALTVTDHDADSVTFHLGALSASASRDQVESALWAFRDVEHPATTRLEGIRLDESQLSSLLASMDATEGCHDCAGTIAGGPCPGHKARWSR